MMLPVGIGIDIGGTSLRAATVAADGTILERVRRSTPANESARLVTTLDEVIGSLPDHLPVGVGIAGLVAADGTVRYGPNIGVRELALAQELRSSVGRDVHVLNDASAAALGEQRAGAALGREDVLMFTLGTGVGGGVVVAGELVVGASGFAGELGHVMVEEGGRRCPCGNLGCIEAYASGTAIGRLATERLAASTRPSMLRSTGLVDGAAVSRAAGDGDELAVEVLTDVGRWLGVAIASCVNALDPEVVLIGGGAGASTADWVLPAAAAAMGSRLIGAAFRTAPPIELAVLGDDAGTVGAALFAVERAALVEAER